jgi:hypothetical protein
MDSPIVDFVYWIVLSIGILVVVEVIHLVTVRPIQSDSAGIPRRISGPIGEISNPLLTRAPTDPEDPGK